MKYVAVLITCIMVLSGCGYHLAGQADGEGMIPAGADVAIQGAMQRAWQQALSEQLSQHYALRKASDANADTFLLRVLHPSEHLLATAYDASGIAEQYRLQLSAAMLLEHQGKVLWESGTVTVAGDVFATSDTANITSQQEKLSRELYDEWARRALSRMRSGF